MLISSLNMESIFPRSIGNEGQSVKPTEANKHCPRQNERMQKCMCFEKALMTDCEANGIIILLIIILLIIE